MQDFLYNLSKIAALSRLAFVLWLVCLTMYPLVSVKRKASTQKSVLTTAQNNYNKIIQIKRCTEPTDDLKRIHSALKQQKAKPYKQIKFVVHKPPPKKSETQAIAKSAYG